MNLERCGLRARKHIIVAVACAALALSLLVSSAYIAHEAAFHHQCMGENCPVCQFIARVEQLCEGFGLVLLAMLLSGFAVPARPAALGWGEMVNGTALCTLVGRKIRLND